VLLAPLASDGGMGECPRHVPKINRRYCHDGIDLGRNGWDAVALERRAAIVPRQQWSPGEIESLPPMVLCLIGMEPAYKLSRKGISGCN
jgi:hypothetical protein